MTISRRYYASKLGCVLDCDLDTGLQIGTGGAPTNNDAIINALLATATRTSPVELVLDGPTVTRLIVIPPNGYVSIIGIGRSSGFYAANGANSTVLGNKYGAPFEQQATAEFTPAQTGYLVLKNFRIEGNSGGNSTTGDRRGTLSGTWFSASSNFYCGIDLQNLAAVVIEDVFVNNAPMYAIRLGNCSDVSMVNFKMLCTYGPTNGDGIHISGPASRVRITAANINTNSDDAVAINSPEGYAGAISEVLISNSSISGLSVLRVYTGTKTASNIKLHNFSGSATVSAFILGVTPNGTGFPSNVAVDQVADFEASTGKVSVAFGASCFANLCSSFGSLRFKDLVWDSPTQAVPFMGLSNTGLTVSELLLSNVTVYRTTAGNGLSGAIDFFFNLGNGTANTCTIKRLVIDGYNITDQVGQSAGQIPFLLRIPTGCSIGELYIKSLDPTNIALLVDATNGFTNIASVNGPGVLASGFQIPDAVMANNCPYLSATSPHAGQPCIKLAGTVHTLNYT